MSCINTVCIILLKIWFPKSETSTQKLWTAYMKQGWLKACVCVLGLRLWCNAWCHIVAASCVLVIMWIYPLGVAFTLWLCWLCPSELFHCTMLPLTPGHCYTQTVIVQKWNHSANRFLRLLKQSFPITEIQGFFIFTLMVVVKVTAEPTQSLSVHPSLHTI